VVKQTTGETRQSIKYNMLRRPDHPQLPAPLSRASYVSGRPSGLICVISKGAHKGLGEPLEVVEVARRVIKVC
jgi:hypothetical protein